MAAKPDAAATARELVLTRVFDAPRELVWKAWTEPDRVQRWWGPKDFTAPACKMDFRVGGTYLFCMRSPEGQDFWSTGVYREIVPHERIVATDAFADAEGNRVPASHYGMEGDWPDELLVTVTFEDEDGLTRLTLRHAGLPDGTMREMTGTGWNESLDKLAASLAEPAASSPSPAGRGGQEATSADREIVVTRVYDARRELVFAAFTDAEHVSRWWGPRGFRTTTHEMDVRPGGVWRFIMHGPDGVDYHNKIVYLEVAKPERLVYQHAGEGDTEDVRFRTTVTFADEGGRTRLTMRAMFESASDRERAVKEHGAVEGGKQTLERLAEYLAQA